MNRKRLDSEQDSEQDWTVNRRLDREQEAGQGTGGWTGNRRLDSKQERLDSEKEAGQ